MARLSPSLAVVPALALLALVLTWPLARDGGHALPVGDDPVDPLMQAYVLGWNHEVLAGRASHPFDPPRFHPKRRTLTYMDPLFGEAAIAAPLRSAGASLPWAYAALVLSTFVASGWATYRLVRVLGVSCAGGFLAGCVFAFGPYRFANLGNLNQLHTALLPLGLFFAVRALARGRTRDWCGVAATFVAQVYFGWYGAMHLAVALGVLMLATLANRVVWTRARAVRLLAIALVATAALLPIVLPYLHQQRAMPEFRRTLGETALYSADLTDYLRARPRSPLALFLPRGEGRSDWPGWMVVLLGAIGAAGVVGRWRGAARGGVDASSGLGRGGVHSAPRRVGAARSAPRGGARGLGDRLRALGADGAILLIGVVGFVLSLGPRLQVAGRALPVPLPHALLFYVVPGFATMRAPARFAVLVLLAAAVLAGLGFDAIRARIGRRGRAASAVLLAGAVAIVAVEAFEVPIRMVEFPSRLPAVYAWIAQRPRSGALLELPLPASEAEESERDAVRQLWSLRHGWPRVDGVSGFSSAAHEDFRRSMQRFPDAAALDAAHRRDVGLVIVRYGELPAERGDALRRSIAGSPRLRELARFGDDVVYAFDRAPGS